MADLPDPIASEVAQYLDRQDRKDLLRFMTCGSVDDGKSTLIGRLLYEAKALLEDQLAALEADSRKWGTQGRELDLALALDGLAAEREQRITIDVAYRFFSTVRRKFVVADTPGHEQYLRNMVTGASTADAAVVLVDARKGVLPQTRRHSYVLSLIGVRKVALAVNKMDLVGFSEEVFHRIEEDYRAFAGRVGLADVTAIPLSALTGDNVVQPSARMPWYRGPTLMEYLETVDAGEAASAQRPLRMPVQWIGRPHQAFRGCCGLIVDGSVRPGERIVVLPSGQESSVARIVTADGDLESAVVGQSVTLTLTDEIDVSRGDVICSATEPCEVADQFQATIVWLADEAMLPGRDYLLKIGATTVPARVSALKYRVDVNTLEHRAAKTLELNEVGVCNLALEKPIPFDPYAFNRDMGGFILIDRMSNATAGGGMVHFALRRAHNVHRQHLDVDQAARAAIKNQKPCVVWFTGLSAAGKSSIANAVERRLLALGYHTYLVDGDNVRHGLSRDLGFTDADRVENIRRAAEVARLMTDAGLIVLTAFISPFRAERRMARDLMGEAEFIEVFVDAPLSVVEARDPKGLYRKARRGELKNFTGIDSPYEPPESPELRVDTQALGVDDAAEMILALLRGRGVLKRA
jgi:bifunctional enzyme CysN/CysC